MMNASVLGLIGLLSFVIAYYFYANYLSRKIFSLDQLDKDKVPTPAHEFKDGIDYVPTSKSVLLGHHYSSIAGAAPIVGPAVAIIWGWLPAFIWVVLGVITMGAVHDFSALYLSMKFKGESIGKVSESILGSKIRSLFLLVIFFLVWMVIAVFTLVIANLFISFPSAVIPINFEIIISLIMGKYLLQKNKKLLIPSLLAQLLLLVMIFIGTKYPIDLGAQAQSIWIYFLLIYCFIASVLPVWLLLQPRDYINSHQLFLGLGVLILGLIVSSPEVVAPMINTRETGAPPWFPFLFMTIACGAISGFHGLVSSGTSSKQVDKWKDAKAIGYGSMLGEGLLALLATLAVAAGFSSSETWHHHYSSWEQNMGLKANINAFVIGAGKFVSALGIPSEFANTTMAVLIISFAATSLDTATRIQRFIIAEIGEATRVPILKNRYVGSFIAVFSAYLLMISADKGSGGLKLWPLFGATNQMLAGLTLLVVTVYLYRQKKRILPFLLPGLILFVITSLCLLYNLKDYLAAKNYFLVVLASLLFIIQFYIICFSLKALSKERNQL